MPAGWNFNPTYTTLPKSFFRRIAPVPVAAPKLVLLNDDLAVELGLDPDVLRGDSGSVEGGHESNAVYMFAGNQVPEGTEPLAMAYAGHQFGGFTMLGDGRAVLLGEHVTPTGDRFDVQLKGSGPTPFSRGGDGRAALGPMLREYVVSEAMHGLGIPTTRGLAVTTTGEAVFRERPLRGAVLTRVAASHLRVGTFQFAATWHGQEAVRALADYALRRHFPEVASPPDESREGAPDYARYMHLLRGVIERQAALVARWQLVGFVHGVMNTDNMTISGETIDYGPCAFMDAYDPATVFSSIDRRGRYAYGNQPPIAQWNLARLADSLLPLLAEDEEKAIDLAQEVIGEFPDLYRSHWRAGMGAKLGLGGEQSGDVQLIDDLLELMERYSADYTNVFRELTRELLLEATETQKPAGSAERMGTRGDTGLGIETLWDADDWTHWRGRWRARLLRSASSADRKAIAEGMRRTNPALIPRNHRVEQALAAAGEGDLKPIRQLLEVLKNPFAYTTEQEAFAEPPARAREPYVTYCGT